MCYFTETSFDFNQQPSHVPQESTHLQHPSKSWQLSSPVGPEISLVLLVFGTVAPATAPIAAPATNAPPTGTIMLVLPLRFI
mmetsp:Transcript_24530/g.29983  ORF Transcript_24530/g.29983 Transcript_24530/m.29983 type:complete len:82 (+) Transcript_24530:572-817(+)